MSRITLGRTGLQTSVAGLGCGGKSELGRKTHGPQHAVKVVRTAFDLGVNFFDTSPKYGTEYAVAEGLEGIPRDQYIIATKFPFNNKDKTIRTAAELTADLESSLRELKTDYIDIYQLQGVFPHLYTRARDELLPAIIRAQEQGKVRFTGVSEDFVGDMDHQMLQMALKDDCFDVFMLGQNILNQSGSRIVLPQAEKQGIGTLCMYAVRAALSKPDRLRANLEIMIEKGQVDPELVTADEDLSFIIKSGAAKSVTEAAYRYCSHTPGLNVILTGTGNLEHLKDNIDAINGPKLPDDILEKLYKMFGNVDCIAGN